MQKTPPHGLKRYGTNKLRVSRIVICPLLTIALLFPLFSTAIFKAEAVTQAELKSQISNLKNTASDAAARKKELQAQLDAIKSDKEQAMQQHQILVQQLGLISTEISNTQNQIDAYIQLITAEEAALAEAQSREEAAYTRFCQRARSMEESGDISYWSVLFAASDFSDLLDRLAMVDLIMEYDNRVVETLVAARQEVEATLLSLNESKAGLDQQKAQLEAQQAEQAAKVGEAQDIIDQLTTQENAQKALVAASDEEEKKIASELTKKEEALNQLIASQQITFDPGTGYLYPVPASNNVINSRFGPRTHPITKEYHNHSGTDIRVAEGTSIKAVQGGVVATSAYAPNSYGEYVVINHGNGISTLYAHMQRGSRRVKEGDIVSQGQELGLVGSTGMSTGPHLHLELRKDGIRQDALTMFPGMTFIFRD